jgi:hypothetical protein
VPTKAEQANQQTAQPTSRYTGIKLRLDVLPTPFPAAQTPFACRVHWGISPKLANLLGETTKGWKVERHEIFAISDGFDCVDRGDAWFLFYVVL